MLDARLAPLLQSALDPVAGRLAKAGIGANALTWMGFAFGLAAVPAVAAGWYGIGGALFLCNRLFDGLDGAVARRAGATPLGGFLDITLDFIAYAAFPLGFALADPGRNALAAAFLLFAFMGTAASFLAFAAVAARRGLENRRYGPKAIYYLGGLTEGGETIAAFLLFAAFPSAFPWLATIFGGLCCLTAMSRIARGVAAFRDAPTPDPEERHPEKRPPAKADGPS